jgi:hypothetical protein
LTQSIAGAHSSHVHHSTGDAENPFSSACISFSFYSPSIPSHLAPHPDSAVAAALNIIAEAIEPIEGDDYYPDSPTHSHTSMGSSIDSPTALGSSFDDISAPDAVVPQAPPSVIKPNSITTTQPALTALTQPASNVVAAPDHTQPAPTALAQSIPIDASPVLTQPILPITSVGFNHLTLTVMQVVTVAASSNPIANPPVGLTHAAATK